MHDVDAGQRLEQLEAQVLRRAGAGRSIGELAGLRLGERDEIGDRVDRLRGMHEQEERRVGDERNGREVLGRIVGQALVQRCRDRKRRAGAEHDRVAIGRRLGHGRRADHRAGAGPVLHHHRLAQAVRQFLAQHPRQRVEAAAGRIGNHQRHGAAGVVLRRRTLRPRRRGEQNERCRQNETGGSGPVAEPHVSSLPIVNVGLSRQ